MLGSHLNLGAAVRKSGSCVKLVAGLSTTTFPGGRAHGQGAPTPSGSSPCRHQCRSGSAAACRNSCLARIRFRTSPSPREEAPAHCRGRASERLMVPNSGLQYSRSPRVARNASRACRFVARSLFARCSHSRQDCRARSRSATPPDGRRSLRKGRGYATCAAPAQERPAPSRIAGRSSRRPSSNCW